MRTVLQLTLLLHLFLLPAAIASRVPKDADIIIVGAGTAGNALAARLCTQLPRVRILLIERAAPRNKQEELLVRAPRNALAAWTTPIVSEIYPTLPNPGLLNRPQNITTGNTLGGSSSTNGVQWTVPVADSFADWNFLNLTARTAKRYYRRAFRRLQVARQAPSLRPIYSRQFLAAAAAAGFPRGTDPFDFSPRRAAWDNRVAIDRAGRRRDSFTAYLKPVLNTVCRRRVTLLQGYTVAKITLSRRRRSHRLRATGVSLVRTAKPTRRFHVRAAREVIVSAGPFESPKLLQLSGIGTPSVLRAAGVKPLVDLPVGEATQSRPATGFRLVYAKPLEPSNNSSLVRSPRSIKRFLSGRGGLLGKSISSHNARVRRLGYLVVFFVSESAIDLPVFTNSCAGNPKSRGFVHIKSSDPLTPPDVHTNVLGDARDVEQILQCMRAIKGIHENFPPGFNITALPTPDMTNEAFVRGSAVHGLHFVGGCPVGSVLRRNLRVKGVRRLRVVDASSIKTMPISAGPMASVFMLAEYVAEHLVDRYACRFGGRGRRCSSNKVKKNGW